MEVSSVTSLNKVITLAGAPIEWAVNLESHCLWDAPEPQYVSITPYFILFY